MTIELERKPETQELKEKPVCEFRQYQIDSVSKTYSTYMNVDGITLRFFSEKNIDYFKDHYEKLGYEIKVVEK